MPVPGYRRLPDYEETMRAAELIETAISRERAIRVTFFQENGRGWFRDGFDGVFGRRKQLKARPVTRVFEPQRWHVNRDGDPYAEVISLSPTGEERPACRTLRLDRVAVDHRGLRLEILDQPFRVTGTALDPELAPRKRA